MNDDLQYEAPTLIEIGSVKELTRGQVDGNFTDATFPIDTPKPDLTFS